MPKNAADEAEATLRKVALRYPEAHEDFPWGELAIKVRNKIFVCVARTEDGGARVSMKLPESSLEALVLPFTEPTHYGMGKHGWVTSTFGPDEEPPLDLLVDWIDESYRAIAPKGLVAQLPEEGPPPAAKKSSKKKAKATKKKTAQKKAPKRKLA